MKIVRVSITSPKIVRVSITIDIRTIVRTIVITMCITKVVIRTIVITSPSQHLPYSKIPSNSRLFLIFF